MTRNVPKVRAGHPARASHFGPLLQTLRDKAWESDEGATFIFTSATPGEGVSEVISAVAVQLAAATESKVLIAATQAIDEFTPVMGPDCPEPVIRESHRVYRLRPPGPRFGVRRVERDALMSQLTRLFPYVLVEAPALTWSAEALAFGRRSQGMVLVAAAGQLNRNHLRQAKFLSTIAGVPLLGCALNRRTYPIPEFLYTLLERI